MDYRIVRSEGYWPLRYGIESEDAMLWRSVGSAVTLWGAKRLLRRHKANEAKKEARWQINRLHKENPIYTEIE